MRLFKRKSSVTEEVVIGGHKLRVLDPLKMPKIRQAALFLGEYEREWGMTKKDIIAFDNVLLKETDYPENWANKDDLIAQLTEKVKRIYNLLDTRSLLLQEDFQYKPFLKAACHVILIDGENEEKIDNKYYQEKIQLCEASKEVEVFFLRVIRSFMLAIDPSFDITKMWEFYPDKHLLITEKKVLSKIGTTIYSTGE